MICEQLDVQPTKQPTVQHWLIEVLCGTVVCTCIYRQQHSKPQLQNVFSCDVWYLATDSEQYCNCNSDIQTHEVPVRALIGKYIGNQLNMPGVCRCGTMSTAAAASFNLNQSKPQYVRKAIATTCMCLTAHLLYSTKLALKSTISQLRPTMYTQHMPRYQSTQ